MVRLQPDQLAMLDAWIASSSEDATRPEAIRMILVEYLNRRTRQISAANDAAAPKPSRNVAQRTAGRAFAAKAAAGAIDKGLKRKPTRVKAERKRKLTKAPGRVPTKGSKPPAK